MDGKNGELEKLQKDLQEKQPQAESIQSASDRQPSVASETIMGTVERQPFLDDTTKREVLAKAPKVETFDEQVINGPMKEQLAIYYGKNSSDAEKAAAKTKIDELYKLIARQTEIKKALYGPNAVVSKAATAQETQKTADKIKTKSHTSAGAEKTILANLTTSSDSSPSPEFRGEMAEMAAVAKGRSLAEINNIGVRNTTTAELGQTWKVKVSPTTEATKPINPSEFQTTGAATGSFHGRFGGFAEPHPEGTTPSWSHYEKDSESKPAKTSDDKSSAKPKDSTGSTTIKAEKKSRNVKAEEWKISQYEEMRKQESETVSSSASKTGSKTEYSQTAEKKKKTTKAEKEIEARTHSDSMLGPVIPGAEADTRTEEEKLQGDAWEKEFRGPGKSERSKDVEPPNTPEERHQKAKEMAMKRQAERGASAENLQEFGGVYDEWTEARTNSDKLEKEFSEKYEQFLVAESKGWRRWANLPRRMIGLKPEMTDEIRTLYEQSEKARSTYFEKAVLLKDTKQGGTYGDSQKAVERYQRLLAHKLVVGVHGRRLAIQEKVALDARKNSQILPALEQWRRYRYVRWGATALGYAVIGGATGGVGAAVLASGAYGSRLAGAMILGGAAGSVQRYFGAREEKKALKDLSSSQDQVKGDFFSRGFSVAEQEIEKRHKDLEDMRHWKKAGSVAVAAAFGAYGANMGDDYFDTDGTPSVPETKLSPAPHAPVGTNPPPWEGSTTDTPKVEVPNKVPEPQPQTQPAVEFMGDMKVSEAMQPKVEEALTGLPSEAPVPEPRPEIIDAKMHTVVKGDNAWHIMRDESSVLKDMSLAEQNKWQVELWDSLTREEAIDAGFVRSGGNVDFIYPEDAALNLSADKINVSMLDEKLLELMHQDKAGNIPVPEPRPDMTSATDPVMPDGTPLEEVEPHEPTETDVPGPDEFPEHGPVTVRGEVGTFVVEGRTADVNLMTIHDALNLYQGVRVDDPNALALLEEMSTDKESFSGVIKYMMTHGNAQPNDPSMTVEEYINKYKDVPYNPPAESAPADNNNVPTRQASVSGVETVGGQSLESYVRSVEQPKNGFIDNLFGLGKPNVAGTFEQMANLTLGDIKAMDANGELPEGVSETGFDVWSKEIANVAANDNDKTLAEYVSGLANSRVA